jgi:hypothetical protein
MISLIDADATIDSISLQARSRYRLVAVEYEIGQGSGSHVLGEEARCVGSERANREWCVGNQITFAAFARTRSCQKMAVMRVRNGCMEIA